MYQGKLKCFQPIFAGSGFLALVLTMADVILDRPKDVDYLSILTSFIHFYVGIEVVLYGRDLVIVETCLR